MAKEVFLSSRAELTLGTARALTLIKSLYNQDNYPILSKTQMVNIVLKRSPDILKL